MKRERLHLTEANLCCSQFVHQFNIFNCLLLGLLVYLSISSGVSAYRLNSLNVYTCLYYGDFMEVADNLSSSLVRSPSGKTTQIRAVNAPVFPVVLHGAESWTVNAPVFPVVLHGAESWTVKISNKRRSNTSESGAGDDF